MSVVCVASTLGININKGVGVYHAQTWLFNILLTLQSDLNGKAKGMRKKNDIDSENNINK